MEFAKLILKCGLLDNSHITWITFDGAYDFGYFMKTLIGEVLPFEFSEFMYLVKSFFGTKVFDLKEIIKFCDGLNGDLEMVAKSLGVDRADVANLRVRLAGSDSLLTWRRF
jgi:CCR4-NOT transcription complex subunit 7/8